MSEREARWRLLAAMAALVAVMLALLLLGIVWGASR